MPSEILGFCSSLVYMTAYLLEIKTSLVVFSTFKLIFYAFVFYLKSIGLKFHMNIFFQIDKIDKFST